MTAKNNLPNEEEKHTQLLEEICEHTMAIRRVANRILDHLHEYHTGTCKDDENNDPYCDPDELSMEGLDENDDIFL
jgi:hypothetical protein